jgi:hypothetical protein
VLKSSLSVTLLSLVFSILSISPSYAKEFDPSTMLEKIPLLSQAVDVTEKIKTDPTNWKTIEQFLPNLKRMYVYRNPSVNILVGWACGIDDFSKFTINQFKSYHEDMARQTALLDAKNRGGTGEYNFLDGDPITARVKLEYIDGGYLYKDIALDIFATNYCVFSIKVSARQEDLTIEKLNYIENQLAFIRQLVLNEYGTFNFSETGTIIWWSSLINFVVELLVLVVMALIFSSLYIKFVSFQPGSGTQRYSLFIMAITAIASTVTSFGLIVNSEFGPSLFPARLTMLINYVFIFFAHLVAYRTNKKRLVAFAIWLVLSSILFTILSWLLKWQPFNINQLVGAVIGFIVALIALGSSYHKEPLGETTDKTMP